MRYLFAALQTNIKSLKLQLNLIENALSGRREVDARHKQVVISKLSIFVYGVLVAILTPFQTTTNSLCRLYLFSYYGKSPWSEHVFKREYKMSSKSYKWWKLQDNKYNRTKLGQPQELTLLQRLIVNHFIVHHYFWAIAVVEEAGEEFLLALVVA